MTDILRVHAANLSPEEQAGVQDHLINAIVQFVANTGFDNAQRVAQFADLLRNYHGCTSPAEEFIRDLVKDHYNGGLTPNDAAEALKEFSFSFDLVEKSIDRYSAMYTHVALRESKDLPEVKS